MKKKGVKEKERPAVPEPNFSLPQEVLEQLRQIQPDGSQVNFVLCELPGSKNGNGISFDVLPHFHIRDDGTMMLVMP